MVRGGLENRSVFMIYGSHKKIIDLIHQCPIDTTIAYILHDYNYKLNEFFFYINTDDGGGLIPVPPPPGYDTENTILWEKTIFCTPFEAL